MHNSPITWKKIKKHTEKHRICSSVKETIETCQLKTVLAMSWLPRRGKNKKAVVMADHKKKNILCYDHSAVINFRKCNIDTIIM